MSLEEAVEHARYLALSHLGTSGDLRLAPTRLDAVARHLGVAVVAKPCYDDPSYTGSSFFSESGFRIVVLNSLSRPARRAFTLAHELGHVALDHHPPRNAYHEKLANIYAVEILMPPQRIAFQIRQWGADPWFLAGLNGVSLAAMRRRLEELATVLD